jgi:alpha-tubulin suppressor-like RCC1 family protein
VHQDGTVQAWGGNDAGQLGMQVAGAAVATPRTIPGLTRVVAVAAGSSHSLALRDDGTVLSWGDNSSGQLGLGDTASRLQPVPIPALSDVQAISAGGFQSFAIRRDGAVLAWGNNLDGQLGVGGTSPRPIPTPIASVMGNRRVTQIAAGQFHTLARASDGTVWGWGSSSHGQVGAGFGATDRPTQVDGLTTAVAVAAGAAHSMARLGDGTVRTWGKASDGRLGNGTDGSSQSTFVPQRPDLVGVTAIAGGDKHSLALLADGRIGCFGSNFFRQCGRLEITDLRVPAEVGPGFSVQP